MAENNTKKSISTLQDLAKSLGMESYNNTPQDSVELMSRVYGLYREPAVVVGKSMNPTKIKVGSREYQELSKEGKNKAFKSQVTSGISDFGKKYTTPAMAGIVGAVGASTLAPIVAPALLPVTSEAMTAGKVGAQIIGKGLQQAGAQAATNPYGFLGGVAGSLYLGDRVNKEVQKDSEGKYNTWGQLIEDKTGIHRFWGDLTNPGTWIGGGVGSAAGNFGYRVAKNVPVMMRNVATTVKNAIPMARNAVADPMTITSAGYMPRSLAQNFTGKQVVSQGTQATGYSKAGGTRLTGSMNNQSGRPYTTNRSVNGGGYSGQRIVEKTDYSGRALEKVNPLMPLVETPNSYGVMPIFGPERVVLPPAIIPPIVRDPLTRVEQIKQSWGSPEFQEWYKKQPPGTTQNYNGRPIKIVGGSGTLKREVYAKEDNKGNKLDTPVLVPDSTSTLPRPLYFRNYTKELQGAVPPEAERDYNRKLDTKDAPWLK